MADLLAIAHGAGNNLRRLRAAEAIAADIIEADVHLHRGRLEVRHLKTFRRIPFLLWERWYLAPGWTRRMLLDELLAEARPKTRLMLDLKGADPAVPARILQQLGDAAARRPVYVCGQNWHFIDELVDEAGITALHSIGSQDQLVRFLARGERRCQGISIHQRMLTGDLVARLKERAPFLITWPINTPAALARVSDLGVDGVTTDSTEILRTVVAMRKPSS